MEIDHIYICTDRNAIVGDKLIEFGLVEGSSNTHPGQGTANRRFYFHNFMLELLWIEDEREARNERTKPMRLFERCEIDNNNVSPFGIAFRSNETGKELVPFETWDYHPMYLPEHLSIQIAKDTLLSEPMFFYLSFAKRQDDNLNPNCEPMIHKVPLFELSSVKIHINQALEFSDPILNLQNMKGLEIIKDSENLLELVFDNCLLKKSRDFRPDLPLIIKW